MQRPSTQEKGGGGGVTGSRPNRADEWARRNEAKQAAFAVLEVLGKARQIIREVRPNEDVPHVDTSGDPVPPGSRNVPHDDLLDSTAFWGAKQAEAAAAVEEAKAILDKIATEMEAKGITPTRYGLHTFRADFLLAPKSSKAQGNAVTFL